MVEYEGTHEVDEVWNLWIGGELQSVNVHKVEVKREKWGENYQVKHILYGGETQTVTVTESDLEEILKPIILRNEVEDSLE